MTVATTKADLQLKIGAIEEGKKSPQPTLSKMDGINSCSKTQSLN